MLSSSAKVIFKKMGGMNLARAIQRGVSGQADELWRTFADQGWLGVLVPEALGGIGLGVKEMAVIAEELGGIAASLPYSACAVMPSIVLIESQCVEASVHLAALTSGTSHYALAWKETRFPEQADDLRATLSDIDGHLTVTGRKHLVVAGLEPHFYIVAARYRGLPALCLVPTSGAGVQRHDEIAVDGTCYQTLDLAGAPVAHLLASGPDAERIQAKAIEYGTLAACAELYGLMSAALKLTLEYMRTRVQFGQPIGSFQALQHRAADLFIQKDLSFSVLQEALHAVAESTRDADRISMITRAKARCSDAALRIVKDSVQLHGAIGYTDEYDLGCMVKRAMVLSAWLGNGTQQRRAYFHAAYSA
jgi:alkylation response protein AidB-like acyl-CoA dehydrogenase